VKVPTFSVDDQCIKKRGDVVEEWVSNFCVWLVYKEIICKWRKQVVEVDPVNQ
jgi:hypothetical protein